MLNTIEEIKQANKDAGGYFFSPDTMRFFCSRVSRKVYPVADGAFFVTSERYDNNSPRLYSVRFAWTNGDTETVSEFQQYKTSKAAHRAAAGMAAARVNRD